MAIKFIYSVVLLLLALNASFGQTASEIEKSFGKPTNAYSVSEYIWMTPEYSDDGQVCRMRLYPKRISGNTNYHVEHLPFDDFRRLVDQLVPLNKRGAKKQPFRGGATGGGVQWDTFTYEKVEIIYSASFQFDLDAWKNRKPYVFPEQIALLPEKETETPEKPEDDFAIYKNADTEIVTITWLDRKCAAK